MLVFRKTALQQFHYFEKYSGVIEHFTSNKKFVVNFPFIIFRLLVEASTIILELN